KSFTEDIVVEILLRLPIKSLMRFKCVNKRWRCLISDRGFAKLHLQRLKAGDITPSQRIVKSSPLETIDYELLDGGIGGDEGSAGVKHREPRMDDPSWEPDLVGSCDGLVCLAVRRGFLLYNPTTEESRNFSSSDLVLGDDFFHGFGYDSASDDYKIVQGDGSIECQVAILSFKSSCWRRIQIHQESHLAVYNRGVYWNGSFHWCVVDESRNKREAVIMSFDLSEEKFHQVLSVPEVDGDIVFEGLGIHGANLFIYHGTFDARFEAWIMNEYGIGGSWTKLFSVSTEGIPGGELWLIPVAYTRSGKIVFQIDVYQMILFNPEDNTYKNYPIQSDNNVESAIYVETLISPSLGCEPLRI
ncbi:F-box/kelch-repeat protein At3g06240-like, partial [Rhodamnia argentea]|uniref:F-box/kelch-repeat protein At3g06240-like n=1 Tax=Rhodamnia argentea TaxID=178133 RepID=A0A8B8QN73_9MYRT